MKAIKLALVRQRYTPFGGAERFVSRAFDALKSSGATVTLITRQWDGAEGALICNPFFLGSLWRDWGFARCVCRSLARADFDLVQSHERIACCHIYRAGDGVHREWLAQRARVLGLLSRFGIRLNPYHRYVLAAERRLFASSQLKAVICNSNMVKEEIQRHFGLPETKLRVIYSGVDLESFHPRLRQTYRDPMRAKLGIPADATLFLFVGSGFERKGLADALRALALLPATAHLAIVGRDRHADRYRALAQRLGVGARTHFLGPQQDVRPYYGAADAVVLPTLYDPFPNVALEAMACGLPLVTSTKSGAAELIRDDDNGFVCDALDVPALAQNLKRLLDPTTRQRLGAAARTSVEPLSLETMTRQLLDLYQSLAA
jgi:UDP-glucose:(heptosyl)LPS alpha-1,3-glucosyltransferase